jgi:hypothetical protein
MVVEAVQGKAGESGGEKKGGQGGGETAAAAREAVAHNLGKLVDV